LTSSRKKYIHTDAGGDKLLSLDNEKKEILQGDGDIQRSIKEQESSVARSVMLRQLDFFEKNHIEANWPDARSLEYVMAGMFGRLKAVRDLDKKHFQRRAFIDLLKFMKDEGLKPNFQDKLQPLIIHSKLVTIDDDHLQGRLKKYFYKAQELLLIMEASSQVDENSDLRNVDIIRMQGFSQSLMHKILLVNQQLSKLELVRTSLGSTLRCAPRLELQASELEITPEKSGVFLKLRDNFLETRDGLVERINIVLLLEGRSSVRLQEGENHQFSSAFCRNSYLDLRSRASSFLQKLHQVKDENISSRRIRRLTDSGIQRVQQILDEMAEALESDSEAIQRQESSVLITRRLKLLMKYIQLLYQIIFNQVKEFWEQQADEQQKESARKESFDLSTVLSVSDPSHANR